MFGWVKQIINAQPGKQKPNLAANYPETKSSWSSPNEILTMVKSILNNCPKGLKKDLEKTYIGLEE